jgi:hypothetical protein
MRSWLGSGLGRWIVSPLLFVAGCSSSDPPQPAPVQACHQVIDETCAAFERCGMGTKSSCLSQASSVADCSRAVGTSSNLQACLDTLPKVDCSAFPPLPDVCKSVILVKSSTGEPASPEPVESASPVVSGAAHAIIAPRSGP